MFVRNHRAPAAATLTTSSSTTSRPRRIQVLALFFALATACTPGDAPPPSAAPDPVLPADTLGVGTIVVLEIAVAPPAGDVPRGSELVALSTALLEAGFADIAEVVPSVADADPAPGLAVPLGAEVDSFSAALSLRRSGAEVTASVELCEAVDRCDVLEASAAPAQIDQALARILEASQVVLGRRAAATSVAAWRAPLSQDPYALTIAGRGARTLYGPDAPVPMDRRGDPRTDPLTRAERIDPGVAHVPWLAGRRSLGDGLPTEARGLFGRAALRRPASVAFLAAEAATLLAAGRPKDALARYELLDALLPGDPRFVRDHARAALAADDRELAGRVLSRAPLSVDETRDLLALRVEMAPDTARQDELLALWQERVTHDPEPVRRRVTLRVHDDDFAGALGLLPELRARGEDVGPLEAALEAAVADAADAPSILGLRRSLGETTTRLADALSRSRAVGEAQNALVPELGSLCSSKRLPEARGLSVEGAAFRERVVTVRAEVDRARSLAGLEAVQPLVSPAEEARLRRLEEEVARAETAYRVARAWNRAWLAPAMKRCS